MSRAQDISSRLIKDVARVVRENQKLSTATREVEQERDQNTSTFDKLKTDLRDVSRQNSELKEFIADYKQQVEEMEQRLQKMADQRKKQKETIDSLMEENLELKKQLAGKGGEEE